VGRVVLQHYAEALTVSVLKQVAMLARSKDVVLDEAATGELSD
jgi:hypothetical protein